MGLVDTFSPPVEVTLVTGDVIRFKRMLMSDWAAFCVELDKERYAEAAKIVNADAKLSAGERVIALRRAKDEKSDLYEVIYKVTRTVDGVRKLLPFTLVEKDKAELIELIEPTVAASIIDEIVHRPIVPKEKVLPLAISAGIDAASATSETGNSTPPSSGDISISTPESSPSETSLTTASA